MNIIKTVPAALVPLCRLSVQPVKKKKHTHFKNARTTPYLYAAATDVARNRVRYRRDLNPRLRVYIFLISRRSPPVYVCILF